MLYRLSYVRVERILAQEGLAEPRSASGCDGRSEARTQGGPIVDSYWAD